MACPLAPRREEPADPEAKGLVGRLRVYLERSFLVDRTFASPAHFDSQLVEVCSLANARRMRVQGCAPTERVGSDEIGRRIEIHADLSRVWVTCEGAIVADHERVWARHQRITYDQHVVGAKLLRRGRADLLDPLADATTGEVVEIRPSGR